MAGKRVGKIGGRPPVYPKGTVTKVLSARIPERLRAYLHVLAAQRNMPVTKVYAQALYIMLERKPQNDGLRWRQAPSRQNDDFPQVNVIVPLNLALRVEQEADYYSVSIAKYITTTLYFYARYVFPPGGDYKPKPKPKAITNPNELTPPEAKIVDINSRQAKSKADKADKEQHDESPVTSENHE